MYKLCIIDEDATFFWYKTWKREASSKDLIVFRVSENGTQVPKGEKGINTLL